MLLDLVSPTQGLQANYGFFVHNFLATLAFVQGGKWLREFFLQWGSTWPMHVAHLTISALSHTVFYVLFAKLVGRFPVPFCPLLGVGLRIPLGIFLLNCMVRRARRKSNPSAPNRTSSKHETKILIARYKRLLLFEFGLFFVYSAFAFVFRRLDGVFQALFALLLLPLKVALSTMANKLVSHVEDVAPETVVFAVEFFNSMYVSICMGGSTSLWASLALIDFDFVHMGIVMVELTRKARILVETHSKTRNDRKYYGRDDLIGSCIEFAHAHRHELLQSGIRFTASNGLAFRVSQKTFVLKMLNYVQPWSNTFRMLSSNAISTTTRGLFVKEVLEFMFLVEKAVLIEYVEAFTPIFSGESSLGMGNKWYLGCMMTHSSLLGHDL